MAPNELYSDQLATLDRELRVIRQLGRYWLEDVERGTEDLSKYSSTYAFVTFETTYDVTTGDEKINFYGVWVSWPPTGP